MRTRVLSSFSESLASSPNVLWQCSYAAQTFRRKLFHIFKAEYAGKAVVHSTIGCVEVGVGGKKAYAAAKKDIRRGGFGIIGKYALYCPEEYRVVGEHEVGSPFYGLFGCSHGAVEGHQNLFYILPFRAYEQAGIIPVHGELAGSYAVHDIYKIIQLHFYASPVQYLCIRSCGRLSL
jgi:hypothetical protein